MADDALEEFKAIKEKVGCGYFVINISFSALFAREKAEDNFTREDMRMISHYECHNLAADGPKFGCDFVQFGYCPYRSEEIDEVLLYKFEW